MLCERCHDEMSPEDSHDHAGQRLCDDCYMDAMKPASGCDPWAVYLATRSPDQEMNPIQEKILALVTKSGKVEIPELIEATGLALPAIQDEVITLRHMELVTWTRMPDRRVVLRKFHE